MESQCRCLGTGADLPSQHRPPWMMLRANTLVSISDSWSTPCFSFPDHRAAPAQLRVWQAVCCPAPKKYTALSGKMQKAPLLTHGTQPSPGDRPGPDMTIKGCKLLQQEFCRKAESKEGWTLGTEAAVREAGLRDRLHGHIDSWVTGKSSQESLQIPTCPHLLRGEGATCWFPSLLGLEMACCASNIS